uniref:Uncharacterized protein n=1 Tax=Roseihalotalea indica TaxID=2867963 RepID=A0AA49GS33_9BACT|nr:hypothetical protein K4G66_01195 [Tunicatimonas sp. TK19036]
MQSATNDRLAVTISPSRVALILSAIVIFLALANIFVHLAESSFGISPEEMFGLYNFFNMGEEGNLPTYVSALNLLFAGGLLSLIASLDFIRQQKQNWYWWGLAAGFFLMSFDEAAQIHEGIVGNLMIMKFGRGEGVMYYRWYQFYIPLLLIIGLLYIPFVRRLPLRYLLKFGGAAVVFLGGAIGFEMLESYLNYYDEGGKNVSRLFEETGEMLGVVIFIYTLLLYLQEIRVELLFKLKEQEKDEAVYENSHLSA